MPGFLLLNLIKVNVFAVSLVLSRADPLITLFTAPARFRRTGFGRFFRRFPSFCFLFRFRFRGSFLSLYAFGFSFLFRGNMSRATNCLWIELIRFCLDHLFDDWLRRRGNRRRVLGFGKHLFSADVGSFLTNLYVDSATTTRRSTSFYGAERPALKRDLFWPAFGFAVRPLQKCEKGLFLGLINCIALIFLRQPCFLHLLQQAIDWSSHDFS